VAMSKLFKSKSVLFPLLLPFFIEKVCEVESLETTSLCNHRGLLMEVLTVSTLVSIARALKRLTL